MILIILEVRMMLSKKLLTIYNCQFSLPDDFKGTLGEALMLLAEYRLKSENENKIEKQDNDINHYEILQKNDSIKCAISYALSKLSEDKTQWESIIERS